MPAAKKGNRKEQILQCLAEMLESHAGQRITTAKLAENVGKIGKQHVGTPATFEFGLRSFA